MIDKQPLVTVIIPVFNGQDYLQDCLDSVYSQTYQNIEIIVVDDGSTDNTPIILKRNAHNFKQRFIVIDQENSGQGVARNRALSVAKGKYIQFLDADDCLEDLTIELSLQRAVADRSDFVHYDWKFSGLPPKHFDEFLYINKPPYNHHDMLQGQECDKLLQMQHYFSVNNLYKKSFLIRQNIKYGEGYIYEDIPFMVKAVNRAKKVSIINSPFYIIRRNMKSTTRSKHGGDDKHAKSFLAAAHEAIASFSARSKYGSYFLLKYLQTKFLFYYIDRVPWRYRKYFLRGYLAEVSKLDYQIPNGGQPDRILRLNERYQLYSSQRYWLFLMVVSLKLRVLVPLSSIKKQFLKKLRYLRRKIKPTAYSVYRQQPLRSDLILMLGFDNRFSGNSRYLYQELVEDDRFSKMTIKFVTDDSRLPLGSRIEPGSDDYFKSLAQASFVIAESWVPEHVVKRPGSVWIQLWHGTPLKKMFFDSNESEIMKKKRNHKVRLYKNIQKWDLLLADSPVAADKFRSAFLFPDSKLIKTDYPRVSYLKDRSGSYSVRETVLSELGVKDVSQKKIILYAPTWRDYNYDQPDSQKDFKYLMNTTKLMKALGEGYTLLVSDHSYMASGIELGSQVIDASKVETQDLLLAADILITDYSSIMFDAFVINLPVGLFVNDFTKYNKSRGVYQDLWDGVVESAIGQATYRSEILLARAIKSMDSSKMINNFDNDSRFTNHEKVSDVLLSMVNR